MEDKFVYRVYSSFHADDESLVFEYGIYSTFKKAQERLKAVLTKKGGQWKWSETGHSAFQEGAWPGEEDYHYIDKICLDRDIEETTTIWT